MTQLQQSKEPVISRDGAGALRREFVIQREDHLIPLMVAVGAAENHKPPVFIMKGIFGGTTAWASPVY